MELRCAPASAPGIAPNDTAAAAASFGGAPISHGGAAAANTTKGGREQSVGGTARPRSALGRLSRSKILNLGAPEFVKYVLDKDGHDRHETDITRRRFWHNVRRREAGMRGKQTSKFFSAAGSGVLAVCEAYIHQAEEAFERA
jgi:hypothetical protein